MSQEGQGKIYMQAHEVLCNFSSRKQACGTSKRNSTSVLAASA